MQTNGIQIETGNPGIPVRGICSLLHDGVFEEVFYKMLVIACKMYLSLGDGMDLLGWRMWTFIWNRDLVGSC